MTDIIIKFISQKHKPVRIRSDMLWTNGNDAMTSISNISGNIEIYIKEGFKVEKHGYGYDIRPKKLRR